MYKLTEQVLSFLTAYVLKCPKNSRFQLVKKIEWIQLEVNKLHLLTIKAPFLLASVNAFIDK